MSTLERTVARALVTGATGAVGPSLARRLIAEGTAVRALVRSHPEPGLLPDDVELTVGDLTDRAVLERATRDMSVVFHLAAKLHVVRPTRAMHDEYRRVNVEATRALCEAALSAGVTSLVYFSTVSVYGATAGVPLDEGATPRPETIYAETKLEAEHAVRAACVDGVQIGVVLRPAAVYGPRLKGNYERLVEAVRRGRPVLVGDGQNRRTLVHVDDLAAAAVLAARHPRAPGRTYNVTDGATHTLRAIVEAIAAALGRRPSPIRLPESLAWAMAGLLERVFETVGHQPPLDRAAVARLLEDVAISGALIQSELGFRPVYDLEQGWRQALSRR